MVREAFGLGAIARDEVKNVGLLKIRISRCGRAKSSKSCLVLISAKKVGQAKYFYFGHTGDMIRKSGRLLAD